MLGLITIIFALTMVSLFVWLAPKFALGVFCIVGLSFSMIQLIKLIKKLFNKDKA